ncbi:hypothetical protein ABT288_47515 [Streptomyces sp. NPDC001093]|uniref:hypothetical protein n=1 Tax=Streptomyces sp. NPDC001093 TaxID=3154376 RepID=UPI00332D718F
MSRTLLRGAHVITMTPHRPDAEVVDFSERIVISQPALDGCCATPWSSIPSAICGAESTSRPASRRNSPAPGRGRGMLRAGVDGRRQAPT